MKNKYVDWARQSLSGDSFVQMEAFRDKPYEGSDHFPINGIKKYHVEIVRILNSNTHIVEYIVNQYFELNELGEGEANRDLLKVKFNSNGVIESCDYSIIGSGISPCSLYSRRRNIGEEKRVESLLEQCIKDTEGH